MVLTEADYPPRYIKPKRKRKVRADKGVRRGPYKPRA